MNPLQALRIIRTLCNIYSVYFCPEDRSEEAKKRNVKYQNIFVKLLNILRDEGINEN